ncbi:RNA polymerase sigma factor [Falsibacillus albus]|uniref:RNA polymerase sigma factor n=1 Tax=Falsibacillus albus TaxID=2478915 RepID=A0A3L7JH25_9BACI|nr:RNA polymerase sigma factor [Falsibacillus albus]RLQ89983.1 RNA polymerase sigma factor [Falsibacillus albus]
MTEPRIHQTIDSIWRTEAAKIIACLAGIVRDLGVAEDLAQDALVTALERWPQSGIPENPGAWLMTVAKRRAFDLLRRNKLRHIKYGEIGAELDGQLQPDWEEGLDDNISDDLLRLIFTTCHPILSAEARVALTLRLLGGLKIEEIAKAFLVPVTTIAQRIVRAKRTITAAKVPLEVPEKTDFPDRLSSVLEVIYLMFNEGYSASSGESWIRPLLCEEALRVGRLLAEIAPDEKEVHGLVALMEIQTSRFRARVNEEGEPVLLLEQNRAHWDHSAIRRGIDSLKRAEHLGGPLGMYGLQASIASCHAKARTSEETDWIHISALYDALAQVAPSPVVELNRAVAISMAYGWEAGLEIIDSLLVEPALKNYHLLPSTRGHFLEKMGRRREACDEFNRAASLTQNAPERELLLKRAFECLEE